VSTVTRTIAAKNQPNKKLRNGSRKTYHDTSWLNCGSGVLNDTLFRNISHCFQFPAAGMPTSNANIAQMPRRNVLRRAPTNLRTRSRTSSCGPATRTSGAMRSAMVRLVNDIAANTTTPIAASTTFTQNVPQNTSERPTDRNHSAST